MSPAARILFLAPQPFFRLRGMCLAQRSCLQALSAMGMRVDVLTFPFGEDVDIPGVRILRLPAAPWVRDMPIGPSWPKVAQDLLMLSRLPALLLRGRYNVVHACEESAVLAAALKPIFGFRLLYDMDDILSQRTALSGFIRSGSALRTLRAMEGWALRSADVVVTNSADTTAYAQGSVKAPRVVFYDHAPPMPDRSSDPPPASPEKRRVRARHGFNGEKLIVYAGNLEPYQGVDALLASLPAVFARRRDAVCVIVGGERDQIADYSRAAAGLGVASRVRWLGKRDLDETFELLRAADVLVAPLTQPKAVPMKLYAYLSSGVPIVATDLDSHTQLLDRRTALLVPPRAQGLAKGILRALGDRRGSARLARNALGRTRRLLRPGSVLAAMERAYGLLT